MVLGLLDQKDPAPAVQTVLGSRDDVPFVILHGGDADAKIKIECFFELADPTNRIRIRRLTKGETITVRGEYQGQVSNVQVRLCEMVK